MRRRAFVLVLGGALTSARDPSRAAEDDAGDRFSQCLVTRPVYVPTWPLSTRAWAKPATSRDET